MSKPDDVTVALLIGEAAANSFRKYRAESRENFETLSQGKPCSYPIQRAFQSSFSRRPILQEAGWLQELSVTAARFGGLSCVAGSLVTVQIFTFQ